MTWMRPGATFAWRRPALTLAWMGLGLLAAMPAARAQFAVIDMASVTQLIHEAQTLAQQLATARAQLTAAKTLYQSTSGSRGMQRLLGSMTADDLPSSWTALLNAMQGASASNGSLAAAVNASVASEALLSDSQLAALSPDEQASIRSARQSAGLLAALAQQSLSDGQSRLVTLRELNTAIGGAGDQKAILELQAAIGAENGLLQNEVAKLQVLHQAVESQVWSERERDREAVIAGQGRFATRFRPTPP